MEYQKLHVDSKKSWFIARAISTLITGAIILTGRFFIGKSLQGTSFDDFKIFIDGGIGVIIVLMLLNTFIYPAFEYKQWKYIITKDKIEFSEGIFFTKKVTIPIVRVQHIQVNQGPINRWLKLADIHISTAGAQHKIPNIKIEKADEISEYLKNKVKEKVQVNV